MPCILIIEDDIDIKETTQEILEMEDYEVITTKDGKEGITSAIENKPDLILCDIRMPEKDGFEVFQELKENLITTNIPFIFVTAKAEKNDAKTGLEMGANFYLIKPYTEEDLLAAVKESLHQMIIRF